MLLYESIHNFSYHFNSVTKRNQPILLFLTIIFLLITLTRCSDNDRFNNQIVEASSKQRLILNAPPPLPGHYVIITSKEFSAGDVRVAGYDPVTHMVDLYRLESNSNIGVLENRIKLLKEGPSSISEVVYLQPLSNGNIFLDTYDQLVVIDTLGRSVYNFDTRARWKTATDHLPDAEFYRPTANQQNGLNAFYDELSQTIYFPLLYNKFNYLEDKRAHANTVHLFGKLDTETQKIDFLPPTFPDYLSADIYGGLGTMVSIFSVDGKIRYGFFGKPEIYVYNIATSNTEILTNDENYHPPQPLTTFGDPVANMAGFDLFKNIMYNPYNEYTYRTYFKPDPETGRSQVYLNIYDDKNKYRGTRRSVKGTAFYGQLYASTGTYLQAMRSPEDSIEFYLLPQ